jgi:hypothetical protein
MSDEDEMSDAEEDKKSNADGEESVAKVEESKDGSEDAQGERAYLSISALPLDLD